MEKLLILNKNMGEIVMEEIFEESSAMLEERSVNGSNRI
jgi:hypothetical protein